MTKRRMELLSFGVSAALMGLVGVAKVQGSLSAYMVSNLGVIGTDPDSTGPGINNNSNVVGQSAAGSSSVAAYSIAGGPLQPIGSISGTDGAANAVNDGGIAVGYNTSGGTQLAIYSNSSGSTSASLPNFGGSGSVSFATAVNGNAAAFSIVGQSQYAGGGALRAFSWNSSTPGTIKFLGPASDDDGLGGTGAGASSQANGLNASGLIVGYAQTTSAQHAFVYNPTNSKMYDLGVDTTGGSGASVANAINAGGKIVGSTDTDSSTQAFIYSGYNFGVTGGTSSDTTLGNHFLLLTGLDGTSSSAAAINTAGDVVGTSSADGGTASHAFLYQPGSSTNEQDLNLADLIDLPAGWTLDSATGINDAGDITGIADDGSNEYAFLLTPAAVPEPASVGMLFAGAGLMLLRRRHRTFNPTLS